MLTVLVLTTVATVDLALSGRVTWLTDVAFVLACVAAALLVRPRDFFTVGVLPPLLLLGLVTALAVSAPDAVADAGDGPVQAVVSGLAHHAGGLVGGYAATLAVLAVRRLVLATGGRLDTAGDQRGRG